MRDDSKEVAPIEGWAYEAVRKGRRYTSATLGKQPCLQVIVYDKRTEAIEQVKPHWFEVWGVDRNAADAKVWRVEVRAGGAHLKQRWNVRHIDDIDQQLPSIVARGLESFRCVVPSAQDSNVSRWPMSPLWAAAIAHARNVLLKGAPALDPDRLREIDRAQVKAMLEGQIIGCAGSLAHLEGVACSEDLDDEVSTIMAGLVGKALRHPKRPFQGAMKRAAKRYG